MTPAQVQVHRLQWVSAGMFFTLTNGAPGDHGEAVAGMQGMGVSTPIAVAVADATIGFAGEVHMPKGRIFLKGVKSKIVAAGIFCAVDSLSGMTSKLEGAKPKLHFNMAPETTCIDMLINPYGC